MLARTLTGSFAIQPHARQWAQRSAGCWYALNNPEYLLNTPKMISLRFFSSGSNPLPGQY
jgi:hypothetical protein